VLFRSGDKFAISIGSDGAVRLSETDSAAPAASADPARTNLDVGAKGAIAELCFCDVQKAVKLLWQQLH